MERERGSLTKLCSDIIRVRFKWGEYSADWSGVQAISYNYRQRWTGIIPRHTVNGIIDREMEPGHVTMSTIILRD